ncbi:MAG: CoA ester lyase [Chloroflexi bacterium]|nr:CoA ester lyase [Chloroflexota bacterium]MBI4505127.1 CoA ester lyase [Chloroflexota bacterium]
MERTRSLLFAPGSNERILAKVFDCGSDAVDLDLEDAVPTTLKEQARHMVRTVIAGRRGRAAPRIVVRVNGPDSGLTEGDLDAAVQPGVWAVHFTKMRTAEDVRHFAAAVDERERRRGLPIGGISVILSVDSAHLALSLPAVVRATPRMYCLIVGGADFANDLGTQVSDDMLESLWTRSYAVLVSRDAGIAPPLHPPPFNFDDLEGFYRNLRAARKLGFQGGVALHPKQLGPIHEVFAPSAEEIAWAREVLETFRAQEAQGTAAFVVRGRFIDYALVKQAEDVLRLAAEG